tara:strand:+ start:25096 stop:26001 length:906 start_codon:yes stop_codon:yes gene_type:complete
MKRKYTQKFVLISGLGSALFLLLSSCSYKSIKSTSVNDVDIVRPIKAVAALGQLSPSGEIRKLAAPSSGMGGTPRVAELLVKEGEWVSKGQKLAIFDNKPNVLADLNIAKARLRTIDRNIEMKKIENSRYEQAAIKGAVSLVLFEEKKEELILLQGEKDQIIAQINGLESDLKNTFLISPIDGLILRLISRVGERPGPEGVLEVGASQFMQALIEVYESDISRVRIGQAVTLISENGGFSKTLEGNVVRISPQVRQRKVLSTDPTGDADARVVEVQVKLKPESIEAVSGLTGIKVIARFKP